MRIQWKRMFSFLLVCAVVAAAGIIVLTTESEAKPRGWCSKSTNRGVECIYDTVDQCRAAISGVGGSCVRRRH